MSHLLVIEDDAEIGELLRSSLALHGHTVDWERTGRGGLDRASADIDLVLLDLGLPDLDGLEVCRQLRLVLPTTVIVMLTARAREMDVVVGLEVGADDYLVKPVPLAELVARVRAHLRRTEPAKTAATHSVGDLTVSVESRRATVDGNELPLRPREFDLLARLIVEPGSAVSRETLMSEVWDQHWFGSTKTLDVHVAALRRKLSETGRTVPQIVTVRGHGYRLEAP
ncbi:response regulator transcription factor [Pseudonocardia abyssalis]|uniref:Response regulator transcription factor n=1 Tax=Pseudonocardia abyssalis TaxID=2792008 RepID=A0ABS6UVI1_9PSEU|nr:response regulator transcription factor [Pseudonocardia abyssalis]MBW0113796.1 response regulator transcription factor [Pseudonocardia abyssalis]MBW0136260.1 response regulator transcription factor [Pseudonocardia abyssalis]